MRRVVFIYFVTIIFIGQAFSQIPNDEANRREAEKRALEVLQNNIRREHLERQRREEERLREKARVEATIRARQPKTPPRIEKPTAEDKILLEPSSEDKLLYKNFTEGKKGGLFVLYSHPNCEIYGNKNRTVNSNCENNGLTLTGGGSQYSFRDGTHVAGNWSDILFKDEKLYARGDFMQHWTTSRSLGGYVQGIIVNLGQVKIEEISPTSYLIDELKKFKPARNFQEAKKISDELNEKITMKNQTFSESARLTVGNTYLLRSIPYRSENKYYDAPKYYFDVIVAFQVAKRENNKLLVVWKELTRQESPKAE